MNVMWPELWKTLSGNDYLGALVSFRRIIDANWRVPFFLAHFKGWAHATLVHSQSLFVVNLASAAAASPRGARISSNRTNLLIQMYRLPFAAVPCLPFLLTQVLTFAYV